MQKVLLATSLSSIFLAGCAGMTGGSDLPPCSADLNAPGGYVSTTGGNVVTTGKDGITRTSAWSADNIFDPCEGLAAAEPEPVAEPEPEPEPEPVAEPVPVNVPIKLDARALFATNSADLSGTGLAALDQLAAGIADLNQVNRVVVVGHTDSTGSEAYNQGLSERRASSVRDYLATKLPNLDIASIGRGETRPVADNGTALGRAKNRRVEVVVIGTKQEMK